MQKYGRRDAGWKTKLDGLVSNLDHVSPRDKSKVVAHVNELLMILEELGDRVHRRNAECPTQWEPGKTELIGEFRPTTGRWEEVRPAVSPGDIGG
ncbi:MAG: hypothetical protein FJ118_12005 [Deltaproteobacteria bacterium]|nr:hypothetical protein [Deltaproteobacteria bacterium]